MTPRDALRDAIAEALKRLPYADVIVPDDAWAGDYADAAIAAIEAAGVRLVPSGRRADRDNPEGKGMHTLDVLHAGIAIISPARLSSVKDRDDAGNLVADIYAAMIAASPYAAEETGGE